MKLSEIAFPVYRVARTVISEPPLLYTIVINKEGDEEVRVVDDTSIDAETLGRRRLVLASRGTPLQKVSTAIFFLGDLIKMGSTSEWFVDTNGLAFKYKKVKYSKLLFKPIERLIPIKTGGYIVLVEGIPARFKTLYSPRDKVFKYAGVLLLNKHSYILYGLYEERPEDSWRKI
jgi:hypothetical protein